MLDLTFSKSGGILTQSSQFSGAGPQASPFTIIKERPTVLRAFLVTVANVIIGQPRPSAALPWPHANTVTNFRVKLMIRKWTGFIDSNDSDELKFPSRTSNNCS